MPGSAAILAAPRVGEAPALPGKTLVQYNRTRAKHLPSAGQSEMFHDPVRHFLQGVETHLV